MFAPRLVQHLRTQGGAVLVVRRFRVARERRVRTEPRQPARLGHQLEMVDDLLHHARHVTEERVEIHGQHPVGPLVEYLAPGQRFGQPAHRREFAGRQRVQGLRVA